MSPHCVAHSNAQSASYPFARAYSSAAVWPAEYLSAARPLPSGAMAVMLCRGNRVWCWSGGRWGRAGDEAPDRVARAAVQNYRAAEACVALDGESE